MFPIKHKALVFLVSFLLILIIITAILSNLWPKYEMQFFELGILDKNKAAVQYFEDANSTIDIGSQLSWFIYLHNHFRDIQKINVQVKLVNSTAQLPNDRENKHSPAFSFVEFPFSLSVNETAYVPFSWSILSADFQNASILIKRLMVNDQIVEVNVLGSSFYMIFELWVYDSISQKYNFGWRSEGGSSSASLYVEFNLDQNPDEA